MTDLKKCASGARDRCQAAGANQLGQSIPIFEPEVVSRETFHAGEAQANSVDGASHGLGARPASANVLIAAALPIASRQTGQMPRDPDCPTLPSGAACLESAGASTTAGRILQARLHVFHRHFE